VGNTTTTTFSFYFTGQFFIVRGNGVGWLQAWLMVGLEGMAMLKDNLLALATVQ